MDTRAHNPKQQYVSRLLYMHICIFVFICMCKGRCAHICTWQLGLLGFCVLISFEWRLIAQKAERWTLPAFNGCLAAAVHFFSQISVSSAKSCNDNLFHHCNHYQGGARCIVQEKSCCGNSKRLCQLRFVKSIVEHDFFS